jgi:hypothetical protein
MLLMVVGGALGVAACSGSGSTSKAETPMDAAAPKLVLPPKADAQVGARDGRAHEAAVDAGWDATAVCGAADASSQLACGTLTFAKSTVATRPRNHHVTLTTPIGSSTMLYAVAGVNDDAAIDYVDRVPIAEDGTIGTWVSEPPLPVAAGGLVGDIVAGVLVVAGGTTPSGVTDQAYSSVIQADGSLAPWQPAGTVLEPRMHASSLTRGSTMWILGGFNNQTVYGDIVSATVRADGTVSTWAPAGMLPGPLSHFSLTLLDDYVYIAGGLAASAFDDPPDLAGVWRGQIEADGTIGNWTQMTSLLVAEATHASFSYGGYLYVCGGINDVPAQEDRCWRSPVLSDHTLGTFVEVASLPIARGHVHQMPVIGHNVYSIGGAIDFNLDSTSEIDVGTFETDPSKMPGQSTPRLPGVVTAGPKPRHGAKCHLGTSPQPERDGR